MSLLKQLFSDLGFSQVKTFINSGNVIFSTPSEDTSNLTTKIELSIKQAVGFEVPVALRDLSAMQNTVVALPKEWTNNSAMKCDVLFLWDDVNTPGIVDELPIRPGIDNALYTSGAIVWSVDRSNATRSGMQKIIGTPLYKKITIRNCNTVRKLLALMETL